ncbi:MULTISPECIES: GatB/YqeY domain-containing protein [Anaerolinea]|uniref:GatB/YqeY domain-containing protein n=1 Tax=Anaerolinea thermophila (strain DSM 14523 / JCM 11388 / NBRC 100420 / UNI-1) TaxID=926569 RepID=E8N4U9_ANATU|nr:MULTISPECIES: GatB/YqeY domain-containing protein [Anaerolinea]BAJ63463.1 hypothetical protein ANT_14350 [Anaerolinea thermophila UNI-1]
MLSRQSIEQALKEAMRSNDEVARRTLRMILSAIKLAEVEKGASLDETALVAVLQKELKSRRESIADAEKANRPDLAEAAKAEIAVIESFLPKQLTLEELEQIAREAILEANATTPADMGKVMKILMPKVQGRAAGDQVSQMVRKLLQG